MWRCKYATIPCLHTAICNNIDYTVGLHKFLVITYTNFFGDGGADGDEGGGGGSPPPLDRRFLDITRRDYDHLPWYFQDSEDDLTRLALSFPEGDLPSKRPHSIAAPGDGAGDCAGDGGADGGGFRRGGPA
ncbi:Protein of unknown function, partial [Gryllus bimaculatus]